MSLASLTAPRAALAAALLRLAPLALGLAAASGAVAAEAGKEGGKDKAGKDGGQYVNISPVAAPIVVNGRLINYVFVTVRLVISPSGDQIRLRDKEPYFRDALVRAAHRTPFVKPGDYSHVDQAALIRTMTAESVKIAGPGQIAKVEILNAQPRKVFDLPTAQGAAAGERPPVP